MIPLLSLSLNDNDSKDDDRDAARIKSWSSDLKGLDKSPEKNTYSVALS